MSFKFNFGVDAKADNDEDVDDNDKEQCGLRKFQIHGSRFDSNHPHCKFDSFVIGDVTLNYVNPDHAASCIEDESISSLITSSDLESGQYEGGLKIWECTYDLLKYIDERGDSLMANKRVLDLGCGAGLLGLFALLKGAECVTLQDYNYEVIEAFTMPSACASIKELVGQSFDNRIEFISGDWDDLVVQMKGRQHKPFDLIFSSETIYNVKYYPKIRNVLTELLSTDGMALFAAKTHYFGVGGGTYDFVNFLSDGIFSVTTEMKMKDGLSREILKVSKKKI